MTGNCNRWLVYFAAAYLALQATNFGTFWRSATFIGAVLLAACAWREQQSRPDGRITSPGLIVLIPLVVWLTWSSLTWFWSVNPAYSRQELKAEVLDTALMMGTFYIAARSTASFRLIMSAVIGSFAFFTALACILSLLPWGWNPDRFHHGIGPFSTYLVLMAPLLLLLAPAPIGFRRDGRSLVAGAILLVLLLASAKLTNNRIVWIALFTVLAVAAIGGCWRWPRALVRTGWRWVLPLALVVLVLVLAFLSAVVERNEINYAGISSVQEALAEDPRLALWSSTFEKIRARPWQGYGFGRKILAAELTRELHDPLLTHAHNIFVSQWLQVGAVGLLAFVSLLAGIAWRMLTFLRSRDDALALVGLIGLSLLAGMVVKNLTDDFMFDSNGRAFWCLMAVLLGYGSSKSRHDTEVPWPSTRQKSGGSATTNPSPTIATAAPTPGSSMAVHRSRRLHRRT